MLLVKRAIRRIRTASGRAQGPGRGNVSYAAAPRPFVSAALVVVAMTNPFTAAGPAGTRPKDDQRWSGAEFVRWAVPVSDAREAERLAMQYATAYAHSDFDHMYTLLAPSVRARLSRSEFRSREASRRAKVALVEVGKPGPLIVPWDTGLLSIQIRNLVVMAQGSRKGRRLSGHTSVWMTREGARWHVCANPPDRDSLPVGPVARILDACTYRGFVAEASAEALFSQAELVLSSDKSARATDLPDWFAQETTALRSEGVPFCSFLHECVQRADDRAVVRASLVLSTSDLGQPREAVYRAEVRKTDAKPPAFTWRIEGIERVGVRPLTDERGREMVVDNLRIYHEAASAALVDLLGSWQRSDARGVKDLSGSPLQPFIAERLQQKNLPESFGTPHLLTWIPYPDFGVRFEVKITFAGKDAPDRLPTGVYHVEVGGPGAPGEWVVMSLRPADEQAGKRKVGSDDAK